MGFDASGVGVDEDVSRLDGVILGHTHFSEDVFDGGAHVVDFDMYRDVMWDVESFEQSNVPFAKGVGDAGLSIGDRRVSPRPDLIASIVYICGNHWEWEWFIFACIMWNASASCRHPRRCDP